MERANPWLIHTQYLSMMIDIRAPRSTRCYNVHFKWRSNRLQAEKMIDQVRKAFIKNLKNLDWMDAETRRKAEEKANAITDMVGFPDFILHPNELDERYKDLVVKQNEYFQNNIRVNKYNLRKNLEKLDRPVNKTTWIMTPPTVNAYYWPTKNQMVFPAGILQSPFYDMENPNSLNFGGIGVVMGHELTHAFDDQGMTCSQMFLKTLKQNPIYPNKAENTRSYD